MNPTRLIASYLLNNPRKSVTFTFIINFIITFVIFPMPQFSGQLVQGCTWDPQGISPQGQMIPHLVLPRATARGWPNRAGGSACQCLTQAQAKQAVPALAHGVKALASSEFVIRQICDLLCSQNCQQKWRRKSTSFMEATLSIWDKLRRCYELLFEAGHSEIERGRVTGWNRWTRTGLDFRKALLPKQNCWRSGPGRVSALLARSSPV